MNRTASYLILAASLFGLVALLHLLRVVNGWGFQFGPYELPVWFSIGGVLLPGALCFWGFRLWHGSNAAPAD